MLKVETAPVLLRSNSSSSRATLNQSTHQPTIHPLDDYYYSVVDEPQLELNIWFHLGNPILVGNNRSLKVDSHFDAR